MKEPRIDEFHDVDEWFQQLVDRMPMERRVGSATAQEVVKVFAPKDLLSGLDMMQLYDGLPIAVLRGLSKEYIDSLPENLQQQIRQRLQDEAH